MNRFILGAPHQSAHVEYETQILNADGSVAKRRAAKRNLILDQGLDFLAGGSWSTFFRHCAVGTGVTPTKRDSGAITFTRVGDQVTASAGFFEAADVGRLIKWDSGTEDYITAFTSATVVTTRSAGAVAAGEGTVWYVNQTAHGAEVARTGNCATDAGANATTFAVDTITRQRTFLFPAVAGAVTYREIGWSHVAGAGANLNGRDLIPGAGDSLAAGQLYKVIVKLIVKIGPAAPLAVADVGVGGYNTAGTAMLEYIGTAQNGAAFSRVTASGSSDDTSDGSRPAGLEPGSSICVSIRADDWAQNAAISTGTIGGDGIGSRYCGVSAYANGNFYTDHTATFPESVGNQTHYGLNFGSSSHDDGLSCFRNFTVKFTTPTNAKTSNHWLTVTLRKSWGRTLVN